MARGDTDAAAAAAAAAAASRLEEVAEQGRRRVLGDLWLLEGSGAWRLLSGTADGGAGVGADGGAGAEGGGAAGGGVSAAVAAAEEAEAPVARQAHAALAHRRGERCEAAGCLLVFGGCDARDVPLDDLWLFGMQEREP